jgi:uncharacterized protein YqgV (UPF0045/DUF77 family)
MEVRVLRKEMNQLFSKVESLQKALSKFGGKSALKEMKIDKRKKKELKEESRPHTAK